MVLKNITPLKNYNHFLNELGHIPSIQIPIVFKIFNPLPALYSMLGRSEHLALAYSAVSEKAVFHCRCFARGGGATDFNLVKN